MKEIYIAGRPSGFTRSILEAGGKIVTQAVCDYCDQHIVGSADERLIEVELEHRNGCLGLNAKQAS